MRKNRSFATSYLFIIGALFLLFMFVGCSEEAVPTAAENPTDTLSKGKVVHHASMGGADFCEAVGLPTGCDANFSLTANEKADGTVSGQWQDTFTGGGEGIHVNIDCLNIVGGNFAIIGGVITKGTAGGVDVSGQRAVTAVVDNGTSTNDPPDQLSFSFIGNVATNLLGSTDCDELTPADFQGFLNDLTHGQVKVY